ncbi:PAS domain-containing sensor histidine kinase [Comamonas resistens]|uniref:histidine kinase n=1 Tax=Comamonas resistens TaxID=3046670 RepID=A0ABY8SQD5_9BURK|nr:PAS domain-containing sensor histidine kinase [Comamonas resistens]MDL5034858.1 response regulator [Comamonas resistens]WHS63486.1 response regulator [Comamonas resistens]
MSSPLPSTPDLPIGLTDTASAEPAELPLHALLSPLGAAAGTVTEIRPIIPEDDDPLHALVAELRNYQHELELQNEVLNYSQAVAESASERFETLFASIPLPLLVVDEYDLVVQANAMAHRAFQPTEKDRLLINFKPFVHGQDALRVEQAFERARGTGRAEVHEVVFQITDNEQLCGDLHVAGVAVPQQNGPPTLQYLCAVVNQGPLLAERQALQERNQQLYASERRLESVINSALDAIICLDSRQRITVFNPTAAALFLCSPNDALGKPLEQFLPDASRALAFAPLTTQAVLGEMTGITSNGLEIPVEVSISFERHTNGDTTTVFARDLTSRKRAEAQRGALENQLRESHKMQAVGTMAGGIAHDFNNIVGAILGNVELAKADCLDNPAAQESLREIEKAGRRARDLVRQILTFSRNDQPERRPVQVREIMLDTARLLRVSLPPAIELQVHEPVGKLPTLLADPTQVEQALFNLCNNAMQALGDERGQIQLKVFCLTPDSYHCERMGLPVAEYMVFMVQDSGPGMDATTQRRIFEPFFTTKPVGQGTGLGLSVVHGVMRTHGGAVDVHSEPGHGSCFMLYFPVSAGHPAEQSTPSAAPAASSPVTPSPAAAERHVIYVDDDQALVFLFQRLLRRRGYQVSGFTDPREAVAALQADPKRYDLLVTDYNMPGFSGVDLLMQVREIHPALPVALASGYVTAEIEQAALAAGAKALIHKPNDVQEFCMTVHELLNP